MEGIISKAVTARYSPGRSTTWIKVKHAQSDEFVIVGFTAPKRSRNGFRIPADGHARAWGAAVCRPRRHRLRRSGAARHERRSCAGMCGRRPRCSCRRTFP